MFRTKIITITDQCLSRADSSNGISASSDYFAMRRDFPEKLANALIEFDPRFEIVYNQKATASTISTSDSYLKNVAYVSAAVLSHPALGGMYLQIMQPFLDTEYTNSYNDLWLGYRRTLPSEVTYSARGYLRATYVRVLRAIGDLEQSFNVRVATIDDENFLAIGIAGYNASPDTYNFWFLEAENIQDVEPKRKSYGYDGTNLDDLSTTYYIGAPSYYLPVIVDEEHGKPLFTSMIHVLASSGSATVTGYVLSHCIYISSSVLMPRRYYAIEGTRYYALTNKILVLAEEE